MIEQNLDILVETDFDPFELLGVEQKRSPRGKRLVQFSANNAGAGYEQELILEETDFDPFKFLGVERKITPRGNKLVQFSPNVSFSSDGDIKALLKGDHHCESNPPSPVAVVRATMLAAKINSSKNSEDMFWDHEEDLYLADDEAKGASAGSRRTL